MMVFGGSSNQPLAKALADKLEVKMGEVELGRFVNDEVRVWVKEKRVSREVVVVQSLSRPTDHHLVEFCLLCDALRRKGAKEITAVIPWLGYSKQDKVFRLGEPLSVKVIAKMLQTVPLERIITFDLHNLAILGFFEVPVVNLSANELFLEYFKGIKNDKAIVVAPDAGAVKSSTAFAQELGVGVAYIDKKRDLVTGEVTIHDVNRPVEGSEVIIIDDMIVTGGTLLRAAEFLKEKGVKKIMVAATHHLYVDGAQEKIEKSKIDKLVVTNTIEGNAGDAGLELIGVEGLLAEEITED